MDQHDAQMGNQDERTELHDAQKEERDTQDERMELDNAEGPLQACNELAVHNQMNMDNQLAIRNQLPIDSQLAGWVSELNAIHQELTTGLEMYQVFQRACDDRFAQMALEHMDP